MNTDAPRSWSPLDVAATWFGVGLLPAAPGTWGSLAALPLAALLQWLGGAAALLAAAILVFALGVVAADAYIVRTGSKDPQAVVIDEVAGQLTALVPLGLNPWGYLIAFAAFRLFDVLKPWPLRRLERLPGGWGVMTDDLLAGGFAGLAAYAILIVTGVGEP